MKILIYGLNFKPENVGIGKYTGELADFLHNKKHKIKVICSPKYYPNWKTSINKYHIENMLAAELVLVDKNLMPKTHNELKEWVIEKSQQKDYLVKTDVALDVYDIIGGGPVPKHIKPIWPFIAFTAFNTLPKEFKDIYGIKSSKLKSALVNFNLFLLKFTRPFLPPFFRLIAPARWAKQRITKSPQLKFSDKANY